jgi:hypothetical protein
MSDIASRVEGLSERYKIGPREPYKARRDVMTDAFTSPFRRLGSSFQRSNVQTCQRSTFNSPFEIETGARHSVSPFLRVPISPSRLWALRFPASPVLRFAMVNLQSAMRCSRAPERSGAPLQPFRCLPPTAFCLVVLSRFTFHVLRFPESFRIRMEPRTLHVGL